MKNSLQPNEVLLKMLRNEMDKFYAKVGVTKDCKVDIPAPKIIDI